MGQDMAGQVFARVALAGLTAVALAGCQMGGAAAPTDGATTAATATARSTKLVDRDVEAPDIFNVTDSALWDGRPSLGGVWVASEKATDPERVILRNPASGKFVIGALFKREAFNPGPPLQISSDAAAALGLVAGQPATISVTALRREEVTVEAPDATRPILDANEAVATTSLDGAATAASPASGTATASAAAAINRAEAAAKPAASAPAPVVPNAPAPLTAAPKPAAAPAAVPAATEGGTRVQIGIFSVKANAQRAVDQLKKAGIAATIREGEAKGKAYWSVTASGSGAGKAFLDKVKGLGFADAYLLSR
ncbi:MAG: SPOR domain-containing protein [Rhodobacteraceae bacterium PARR1]|nr:MAG: SPOR domain-containing protein [Rhodobacteraceae bacterium PARR1]